MLYLTVNGVTGHLLGGDDETVRKRKLIIVTLQWVTRECRQAEVMESYAHAMLNMFNVNTTS